MNVDTTTASTGFAGFVAEVEPRLRRAFVAAYGPDRGRDAVAEALAYAWEHWDDVQCMTNPAGYLYRVGQSRTRSRRRRHLFQPAADDSTPWVEPGLPAALDRLSGNQRLAVVLVHGFGWTLGEVVDLTGLSKSSVQTHLERGLKKLRSDLGGTDA